MVKHLVVASILLVVIETSCSPSGSAVPSCVPGKSETCACPGSAQAGFQTCLTSGTFSTCSCPGGVVAAPAAPKPVAPAHITLDDVYAFAPAKFKPEIQWEGDLGKDGLPEAAISYEEEYDYGPESPKSGGTAYALLLGYRGAAWQKIWSGDFACDSGGTEVKWNTTQLFSVSTSGTFSVLFDASCRDTDTLTQYTLEVSSGSIRQVDKAEKVYSVGELSSQSGKFPIVEKGCGEWNIVEIDVTANKKKILDVFSKPDMRIRVFKAKEAVIDSGIVKDTYTINYPPTERPSFSANTAPKFAVYEADLTGEHVLFEGRMTFSRNRHKSMLSWNENGHHVTFWIGCAKYIP